MLSSDDRVPAYALHLAFGVSKVVVWISAGSRSSVHRVVAVLHSEDEREDPVAALLVILGDGLTIFCS